MRKEHFRQGIARAKALGQEHTQDVEHSEEPGATVVGTEEAKGSEQEKRSER